jgi:hypothetical protein
MVRFRSTTVVALVGTLVLASACASTPADGRAGNGAPAAAEIAGEYNVAWMFRGSEMPIQLLIEGASDDYVVYWTADREAPKRAESVRFSRGTLTFIVPGSSPMSVRLSFRGDGVTGRWTTGEFGGPQISGAIRGQRLL